MFIVKNSTTATNGKTYYSYRIVESVRSDKGVGRNSLLNLGSKFSGPQEQLGI